ncbi:MAG TPA: HEAT repeat domain-containing protein [Myxococcota bacterium]|nr:HEAT repeat domain-containing protein [Myxococcota bacterium]
MPAPTPRFSRLGSLLCVFVGLTFALPASAARRSKEDQRASLVWYLNAYELKLTRESLDRIGPDVAELLVDILNTPDAFVKVRVRACAGLGLYPSQQSFDVLRELLHERSLIGNELGVQLRRQALRSLGKGFGDRAVDDIIHLRNDPEPLVREAVAHALGDAGSVRALPMLETWLSVEPVLHVRMAVDSTVARLRGR